jgi:two-component system nitrate/nitrite response regulator NarL
MTGNHVRQKSVVIGQKLPGMMGGIRDLLETLFESVIMVSDESSLLNAVSNIHPDLVVVDLSFPVSGGTGIASLLRQHAPGVKFIVLGTDDAPEIIDACLAAGASGYLLRWHAAKDLIKAVEAARCGHRHVPDQRGG